MSDAVAPPVRETPMQRRLRERAQRDAAPAPVSPPSGSDAVVLTGTVVGAVTKFGDDGRVPTLQECEVHITHAVHQYVLGVGRALRFIRDHELYTHEGYASFEAYVRQRWDWSRQHAHRLIKAVRTAEIVAPYAESEIKEGHTRVLDRIYDGQADAEKATAAVLEVWRGASEFHRPTAESLERVARAKGYLDGDPEERPPAPPTAALAIQFRPVLQVLSDLPALRRLAIEDPDAARQVTSALRAALEELEADLPEEGSRDSPGG